MLHFVSFHFYEGNLFRCAYCKKRGFFPFYPQMHDKCWEKAIRRVTIE